ncbi:hypothetical protein ACU3L3_07245 [Priestia endophytica]
MCECNGEKLCKEKRDELVWLAYEQMKSLLIEMDNSKDLNGYDTKDIFDLIMKIESSYENEEKYWYVD